VLGEQPSPTRARLLGSRAALLGLGGSLAAAEAQFAEALALVEEERDARALGSIEWCQTMSYWSNARAVEAIACGRSAIDHLRRAEDPWNLVDALAWTSFPLGYSGNTPEARTFAEEAAAIGAKLGHLGGECLGRRGLALVWAHEGATLEELERAARDDLERFSAIRSPWVYMSHAWVASILALRGELDAALPYAEDAIRLEPASAWSGLGWAAKFVNRALAGDLDACRRALEDVRARFPSPDDPATTGGIMMLAAAAQGCAIVGLDDEAASLYPLVAARVEQLAVANLFDMTLAHRVAGMAASAAGMWDEAESHFTAARRLVDELPNPLELPHVLHWHAAMLLDRGRPEDRERVRAMFDDALVEYRRFGMPLHEAAVEQLVRQ
jgi:tetratricopeptide (TPR) repeat protein